MTFVTLDPDLIKAPPRVEEVREFDAIPVCAMTGPVPVSVSAEVNALCSAIKALPGVDNFLYWLPADDGGWRWQCTVNGEARAKGLDRGRRGWPWVAGMLRRAKNELEGSVFLPLAGGTMR